MCEHCGCRGVEPIARLMDEHFALLDLAGDVRRQLQDGDRTGAMGTLGQLGDKLLRHVAGEERGVFAALKEQGDFSDAVEELEAEHLAFDVQLDEIDPASPSFARDVTSMMDDLVTHIEKENLGVFPVAVVSLGARGWATIEAAHEAEASFLAASGQSGQRVDAAS